MKRILVAAVPEGVAAVRRIVGAHAELVIATKMDDAILLLRELHCDLVLCGIHFDDSRMFELLRTAKSDGRTRRIPFMCFRATKSDLPTPLFEGTEIACCSLGAAAFVDLIRLQSELGNGGADAQFRELVLDLLVD